jgi:HAD superfamily hydrolase (TIGR01509 family)
MRALLFDMDGLLVDSEPVWLEVEREVFTRLGADRAWTSEDQHSLVGGSIARSAAIMVQRAGSDRPPAEVVGWLVGGMAQRLRDQVRWKPGARELLAAVRSQGAATALVSSSYRVLVDAVLARLPEGSFDVSVSGDEVSRGKPEPDPYLRALALLDVPAATAVVLEDSPTGALAGTAAGCRVVVVPDQPVLPDGHPWVECRSLTEVTPVLLRGLLGRDGSQDVEARGPAGREDGREHAHEG